MNNELFNIYVGNDLICKEVPLHFALIFIKAIYVEFYAEPGLKVTIERITKEETVTEVNND